MEHWLEVFTSRGALEAMDVLAKLGMSALLSAAVGWERELHGRPAGVRTHMLVAIGTTLFCEASRSFGGMSDPTRIAAQVVTGVGFLGAGTIMRLGTEIRGLTSAASIWAVAGIAMTISVGGSFLAVAVVATVLTLFTLEVVDRLEQRALSGAARSPLILRVTSQDVLQEALGALAKAGVEISRTDVSPEGDALRVEVAVSGDRTRVLSLVTGVAGVTSAHFAP